MIHILFGPSPEASLKVALNDLGIGKESIISFWDMFSVGPIWKLHEEVGKENRVAWVKNIWDDGDDFQEYKIRFQQSINQIKDISKGEIITIWVGDNSHEQTGLRYALYLLKDKDIDVLTINTTKSHNELFKKKKILYTILHTGEISPEKLQSIYKQSKHEPPLTQHERENYEKEWLSLSDSQETLRIWRNGRIQILSENYYDEFIITRARKLHGKEKTSGFMKSARLIGDVMGHLDQYIGDAFLEYRLKKLIEAGVFDAEGSFEAMRFYSVRLRS